MPHAIYNDHYDYSMNLSLPMTFRSCEEQCFCCESQNTVDEVPKFLVDIKLCGLEKRKYELCSRRSSYLYERDPKSSSELFLVYKQISMSQHTRVELEYSKLEATSR